MEERLHVRPNTVRVRGFLGRCTGSNPVGSRLTIADDRGSNPLVFFREDNSTRRQCRLEDFSTFQSRREKSVCAEVYVATIL